MQWIVSINCHWQITESKFTSFLSIFLLDNRFASHNRPCSQTKRTSYTGVFGWLRRKEIVDWIGLLHKNRFLSIHVENSIISAHCAPIDRCILFYIKQYAKSFFEREQIKIEDKWSERNVVLRRTSDGSKYNMCVHQNKVMLMMCGPWE